MSTTTTNLGLTKPASTDLIDISVLNTNFDKIDSATQLRGAVVPKTANYTASAWDTVLVDATSGVVTVTLPAPVAGTQVVVKKVDASTNVVTVSPPSGTLDGSPSLSIPSQWESLTVVSDGTNYFAI